MSISSCNEKKEITTSFQWSQLPPVPDAVGFAGSFAGISNGHLIVAGGAQFPEGTRPWSGGIKQWNAKVFAFNNEGDGWKEIGRLPQPMGYGISLNWKDGILFIGGADQKQHFSTVYFITYKNDSLVFDTLPSLPQPLANSCGAIIDDVVYVAGGLLSPSATTTQKTFLSLDLTKPKAEQVWQTLPAWPGVSRMLSVAGVLNNEFYLLSGAALQINAGDTLPRRKYLNDAFVYNTKKGWRKIQDLPHAVVAAPTPAYSNEQRLYVFGGDDGSRADQNAVLKDMHPGFTTDILSYNIRTAAWERAGNVYTNRKPDAADQPNSSTWAPVTTPLVEWRNKIILPQGEVRPGVRTNRVLVASPE